MRALAACWESSSVQRFILPQIPRYQGAPLGQGFCRRKVRAIHLQLAAKYEALAGLNSEKLFGWSGTVGDPAAVPRL